MDTKQSSQCNSFCGYLVVRQEPNNQPTLKVWPAGQGISRAQISVLNFIGINMIIIKTLYQKGGKHQSEHCQNHLESFPGEQWHLYNSLWWSTEKLLSYLRVDQSGLWQTHIPIQRATYFKITNTLPYYQHFFVGVYKYCYNLVTCLQGFNEYRNSLYIHHLQQICKRLSQMFN